MFSFFFATSGVSQIPEKVKLDNGMEIVIPNEARNLLFSSLRLLRTLC